MNLKSKLAGKAMLPLLVTLIVGLAGGVLISNYTILGQSMGQSTSNTADSSRKAEKEILYWVAPMDPTYRRDEPGKSPMGMDLVPVYAEQGADSDAVHVSAAVEQSLGVRTSKAERRSLWRKVEVTGYVGFDESRVSQINLRTEGWIERLLVKNEGERVRKGQLLFEFYSPQLVNAQKEYVQAKRRNDAQMLSAAEEKLMALGMVRADVRQLAKTSRVSNTVQVLAPQDGTVTSLHVREGMFVKPATEIMSLADLSSVWLLAGVFESQADWVTESQSAEARLNYMPGEVFGGRVDYVYPVLDPKTRTLQVRLRFDNPGERLKPNMYARVTIFGKSHPGALSIPLEALIQGQETDRVVVALGGGKYTVYEVMSGIESGDWVEIIAGLEVGDEVVTSAQFLLDSEASLAGSIRRLDASHMAGNEDDRDTVFGNGIVEALDPETRRIRISHGPIEPLGWAAMTMEFDVLPGVNLDIIRIGQSIHFSLSQSDVGDYVIHIIHQPEPAGTGEGAAESQPERAP
ncbi:MAG: efflux RND transporter periplasmic adaptor subunit [Gammaproteobacteria bacterium]|nr:MAG: efflux RND transporter periplasmic adaptor subunit [Gammaproteobacteria bacterium]